MKKARDPARLRGLMTERDLTSREVAMLAECSDRTVRLIASGKPCNPQLARRLARILRGRLDELFDDVESTTEHVGVHSSAVL